MAINFLNNVDYNQNQLLKASVENLATDPTSGVLGQIIYNTTSSTLKVCTTASPTAAVYTAVGDTYGSWVLDADGNGATANITSGATADFVGGLKITTDSTAGGTLNIVHDLLTRTDSTSTDAPAAGATFDAVTSVTSDTTGHISAINVETITLPPDTNDNTLYTLDKAAGSADLILSADGTAQDTISFVGTNDEIEIDKATEDSYTFGFPAAGVILPDGSTATTQASGDNSTKVATTAFVQASVTGLLEFKGGFNANTGILDDGSGDDLYTDVVIEVGDYYVVTTAGNFFGNTATPLTVGDSVIAQNAVPNPAVTAPVEGDFIVVQSDTDLATASTVGLGNVVPGASATITAPYTTGTATLDVVDSTASQKGAVIVDASSDSGLLGIDVSYAAGTASVGLDITGLTGDDGSSEPASNYELPMYDLGGDENFKITIAELNSVVSGANSKTGTITAGNLTGTVTHAFGINTLVQTIDSSGNTVFCGISRTATTSVATISAVEATDITILVQKIG